MDAKVMKEMLEGKSWLNAEYLTQSVSNDSVSLHFSQFPKFVSLSLRKIYSDVECTYATSLFHFFSIKTMKVYFITELNSDYFTAQWDGKTLNLAQLDANYVYAIAFF